MRTLAAELTAPKYAHVERERRWLVDPDRRPDVEGMPHVRIEDRYIDGTRLRLQRMTHSESGEASLKLGKKYETDDPLARPMVTTYLSDAEFALLATLPARVVIKRRYAVPDVAGTFSLDLFEDGLAPLELVEIEWSDEAGLRAIDPPDWIVREVSDDPGYEGGRLARLGVPEETRWPSS